MDRLTTNPLLLCAILVTVTVATYAGTFLGAFQYDDLYTILINVHLDGLDTFVGHLDHMVRPVLYGTFLIDRSLYGHTPTGYHLLNLLLHLGSGLLVYRILTLAATQDTQQVPFWTALLFLIHPIQTEAVTYISGRASGLMAFFYLLSFALYLEAASRRHTGFPHRRYVAGALLSFVLALGSKETAMTFPLALLLWDIVIRRLDGGALRKMVLSHHLPFWFMLIAVAAWAWWHPRYSTLTQFSLEIRPLWDNLLSELHATAFSLLLLFCPWKQSFDHDLPTLHSLLQWPLPLDLLLLGGLAVVAFVSARRVPLLAFGIGWFFVQLIPTTLIPRNDLLSERNLYLASIGLFLVVVLVSFRLIQLLLEAQSRFQLVQIGAGSLGLLAILALCYMTVERNELYRDPVLLWSDTVKKSPQRARPHNNLGHGYLLRDDWERAIEEFRIAAQMDPDYMLARKNLRDAYLHQVGRQ